MRGCTVTVLDHVRSRRTGAVATPVRNLDAVVRHVTFPRSATSDDRSLPELVRTAAIGCSNVTAIEFGLRALTVGEIALSMDSVAEAVGTFGVDDDSVLTMALMTELPDLCASGAEGLADVLAQLRETLELAS